MGAGRAHDRPARRCSGCRRRCARASWKVTVAVHDGAAASSRCWPGFHDTLYGLAVDIGSTTIAAHLCDLATGEVSPRPGMMNPQIRFGEDLMSRVSYVDDEPGRRRAR